MLVPVCLDLTLPSLLLVLLVLELRLFIGMLWLLPMLLLCW
jgi:hypothetical protein